MKIDFALLEKERKDWLSYIDGLPVDQRKRMDDIFRKNNVCASIRQMAAHMEALAKENANK